MQSCEQSLIKRACIKERQLRCLKIISFALREPLSYGEGEPAKPVGEVKLKLLVNIKGEQHEKLTDKGRGCEALRR